MSWALVQASIACWFCDTVIAVGDPARFSETTKAVWCAACAEAGGHGVPPPELASAPVPLLLPPPAAPPANPQPNLFEQPIGRGADQHVAREAIEQLRQTLTGGGEQ